jgi:hypothetical protein
MVKRFISALYSDKLKPQGFRRSGHSFTRANPDYVERFQVQGNPWNGLDSTPLILRPQEPVWRFYVNVAVRLADSPPVHGQFHADCRIGTLVKASEGSYELTETVLEPLVDRLAEHIDVACAQLPARLAEIRAAAARGLYCALPRADHEHRVEGST